MKYILKSFLLITIVAFVYGCSKPISNLDIHEDNVRKNSKALHDFLLNQKKLKQKAYLNFIESIPLEEKIAQLFVVNLEGNTKFEPVENYSLVNQNQKKLIPGGYLFFNYNLNESPKKIMEFTKSINDYCINNKCLVPFLSIDHEGGDVNRLRKINADLPSCKVVSEKLDINNAYKLYDYQAKQLSLLGFNLNFAPVTEVITFQNQDFLGERSYGESSSVIDFSIECLKAYQKNKVGAVIKHFPGNSNTDPHTGLPFIDVSDEEFERMLFPFKKIIEQKPAGVLMSHAIVNSIDKGVPSCLSKKMICETLINDFNFQEIVFSDDIFMGALSKNGYSPDIAVVMAIEAGVNCIMVSEKKIASSVKTLYEKCQQDENFKELINKSFNKIVDFKLQYGIFKFVEFEDGHFEIENSNWEGEINSRVLEFEKIKSNNNEFNLKYF